VLVLTRRLGPKGPSKELIDAIVEFKRRDPRIGSAVQEKDLANHRPPTPSSSTTLGGPIVAICTRCQSQHNYEFAMERACQFDDPSHR